MSPKTLRILVFHGYLLDGTGSNVYNARLARALVALGHEVHLFTQDRHPERCDFVDAAADWDEGTLRVRRLRDGAVRCTVYRPEIGSLLPVYVEDRYEGVEARAFARCSDAEVLAYLDANVDAVNEVVAIVEPHLALANHLVMGPAILARALGEQVPYAVKVHGSALEYTVKPNKERFLPYAREGLSPARGILTGSRHTAESLWEALGRSWTSEHDIVGRTGLGPPGVDVESFAPRSPEAAAAGLERLRAQLTAAFGVAGGGALDADGGALDADGGALDADGGALDADGGALDADGGALDADGGALDAGGDAFARDGARAAAAVARIDPSAGPLVAYVGKLIVSKGVDLLLAAWPLVLAAIPEARLIVVGFGAYEEGLMRLLGSLAAGDLDAAAGFARAGRELEGGPRSELRHMLAFLASLDGEARARYLDGCASLREHVTFTGRLDHGELANLLPACEALVVPSTFPEAFGMVAAEAAACGVLPVCAEHSGLAEVAQALRDAVSSAVGELLSFPVDDDAIPAIAERLVRWLAIDETQRRAAEAGMVATVRELWSWDGVARTVIAAADGTVRAPWIESIGEQHASLDEDRDKR